MCRTLQFVCLSCPPTPKWAASNLTSLCGTGGRAHTRARSRGRPPDWGNSLLPTSSAAVRCVSLAEEKWDSYLALARYGGLDMGLGPEGGAEPEGGRVFWLVRIVGRLWAALHLYREAVARFDRLRRDPRSRSR
jgi:hypothetical protein